MAPIINTPEPSFIKKNFNYINLLLFVGLYVTCFVYLLQDDSKTVPALILICVYHFLFLFFISQLISKKLEISLNWVSIISWSSIFISVLFQLISILIILVCYNYLINNYISKNISLPFSSTLTTEMNDYNNLFVAITSITIVLVGTLLYNDETIMNSQTGFFFQPYYLSIFIYLSSIAILSMSSEAIKISNDFLTFKNNAAISNPNVSIDSKNIPTTSTPSSTSTTSAPTST